MTESESSEFSQNRDRLRAEERHRLALYLHDTVGQVLVLAKLQLARIQDQLREPLDADTQARLQTAVGALIPEVDRAIQTVRSEIFTLRHPAPSDKGVPAALELECEAFRLYRLGPKTGLNRRRPCDIIGTMHPTAIHVVIVDDHRLLRAEIAQIVQKDRRLAVIGEAGDGERAVELARRLYPDVVLMDVQMPKMNGIEATRQIKRLCPEAAVIGLSLSDYAEAMVEAGASAYLSKQHIGEELCPTIHRVNEGSWSQAEEASPHSLLMIDDDAVFLKTVSDALHDEHPDFLIATASSAVEGLRLLNVRRFDAIVSDFRMAGLNGIDLLKECQADSVHIPIVLMTGYGTAALEQDAFEQGACAILQKPLDPEQLYDAVTRAIRRTKWLGGVQTQQLAQRRDQLSMRIQKVDQRLQDTLKRNNSSQEY